MLRSRARVTAGVMHVGLRFMRVMIVMIVTRVMRLGASAISKEIVMLAGSPTCKL